MTFPHMNLMVGHTFANNTITKELNSVYSIDGKLVANVIPSAKYPQDAADMARLFAGSPDMYNALLDTLVWVTQARIALMGQDVPDFAKRLVVINDLEGIEATVRKAIDIVTVDEHPAAKLNKRA